MSVISLPDRDEAVAIAVAQVWEHYLQYVEDLDDLVKERKRKPPVAEALEVQTVAATPQAVCIELELMNFAGGSLRDYQNFAVCRKRKGTAARKSGSQIAGSVRNSI